MTEKIYTKFLFRVGGLCSSPHAYRQGLNKEKKGIRSIWECAENTSQSRWWKQTLKYLSEVMHIKNNGFSVKKKAISTERNMNGNVDAWIDIYLLFDIFH